ncbi:hypothetical protein B0T21DRAFT_411462 [Apiosordaria backusii]|uniref:Uncharacterized protein n=1 Tax=Apiosordaria backusii TaxID=314023 RepID=A0AA40BL72_9PEZI|nr:hypothetical protein B0T21DRAFT_411462 [Apiosordaria backusii]
MSNLSPHSFHIPRKPVPPPRPLTTQTPGSITISQPPSRAATPDPPPASVSKVVVTSPVIHLQTKEKAFNEHGFTATRIDRLCNAMQPLITRHATDAEFEELMREAESYLQEGKRLKKRNQNNPGYGARRGSAVSATGSYGGRRGSAVSATGSYGVAHGHGARKGSVVSTTGSITITKGGNDGKKKIAWATKLKIVVGLGGGKGGRRRGSC